MAPTLTRIKAVLDNYQLIALKDTVVIGVSGGSDSLALLHLLHSLDCCAKIIAVYIDHQLRPAETPAEQKNIESICRELGIQFDFRSVDVNQYVKKNQCSTEEGARILRYEALEEIRKESGSAVIAVAHTADDQVEEFFIRSIRGSSLKGLSGMRVKNKRIIRPVLYESKQTLLNYLAEHSIAFSQDSSNLDRKFLRNRIRLDLLPTLEKNFNPSIRQTILQNMDIIAKDDDYISQESYKAFQECVSSTKSFESENKSLQLSPINLHRFHKAIQRRIIEQCLWSMGIKASYTQIKSILNFIKTAENSREIHLSDGVRVEKRLNTIKFSRPLENGRRRGTQAESMFTPLHIDGPGNYRVNELNITLVFTVSGKGENSLNSSGKLFLDAQKAQFPFILRPPKPGERFRPYNSPGTKKVSRFLADKKIGVKKRSGFPVVVSEDRIIALPGLQIAHQYRVTSDTAEILSIEVV